AVVGAPDLAGAPNLAGAPDLAGATRLAGDDDRQLVMIAETRRGYGQLCRLISRGRMACPKGQSRVSLGDVMALEPGILLLCRDPDMLATLADVPSLRAGLYALCARHREARERTEEGRLRAAAERLGVPTVAAVEVLYHDVARRPLQDVLSCVRHGRTLSAAGGAIKANAEHELKSLEAMRALFADDPAAITRTLEIAARCRFSLSQLRYRYPSSDLREDEGTAALPGRLRALTLTGARARYGGDIPADVMAQLERELALIDELDYGGYFLTMWEIVQFCRREDILCQGRGSAANSAVCYCLGITAIDPVRMDLLFERFISRERAEPPDIDLDIEHQRREEVIQFVYRRHGRRHAAMVNTVIRYRPRSAIRDVGKVLELPAAALDRAARLHDGYGGELRPDALVAAGLLDRDGEEKPDSKDTSRYGERLAHFRRLTAELIGFPRHTATHPGGFLIGAEPVDTLVPIEPAAMPGRTVIQWDKNDVEDLGLFKVDLLGLGALTHVHGCLELIRAHEGEDLELATIPAEDPATYAMCRAADTVGVFQI
ncbi:MAG: error-prone DNA polymerase, partial [Myxococcales bacterium]|nr:error-prone DNA polymerase [Myxococcales bacterium]